MEWVTWKESCGTVSDNKLLTEEHPTLLEYLSREYGSLQTDP